MIEMPRAVPDRRSDRRGRGVLLLRHERPDADDLRLQPRRRRRSSCRPTSSSGSCRPIRSRRSTGGAWAGSMRLAIERRAGRRSGAQGRRLRRARRRPALGARSSTRRGRGLRLLLAVPRAGRAPGRGARGAHGAHGGRLGRAPEPATFDAPPTGTIVARPFFRDLHTMATKRPKKPPAAREGPAQERARAPRARRRPASEAAAGAGQAARAPPAKRRTRRRRRRRGRVRRQAPAAGRRLPARRIPAAEPRRASQVQAALLEERESCAGLSQTPRATAATARATAPRTTSTTR